tara:strand:+ start:813 stop:1268 length:456 start_codon:yes stop_codon:yes gene_type:complete
MNETYFKESESVVDTIIEEWGTEIHKSQDEGLQQSFNQVKTSLEKFKGEITKRGYKGYFVDERKWIDPEDMWDRHSFALDDRRTVIACVKSMLSDQGFTPEEPCPELRINRQSFDNIIEGIEHDDEGNVWADDLLEYLAYYLEHAPQEVRL